MEQNGNSKKLDPVPTVTGASRGRCNRLCLFCSRIFRAPGPFIRICLACKESEEWQSGNCDVVLNPPANDNAPGC
ncbi:hypothetical protein A8950_2321 [Dongia mobilis]|uniref:Uncharacterized protein n=1 Tax=Dongia mobilis TaxID=578943 RepID=A0A4V3DF02_9PROT|nr:hypothetical protein [Dongia mobilis]TDQ82498.1 hypothetical protein A8950_2321 [Dongia mobilis]